MANGTVGDRSEEDKGDGTSSAPAMEELWTALSATVAARTRDLVAQAMGRRRRVWTIRCGRRC